MGDTPNYDNRYDSEIEKRANSSSIGDRIGAIHSSKLGERIEESMGVNENISVDTSNLKLDSLVFQEKRVTNSFGKEVKKNIPVKEVRRGAKVVYINRLISSANKVKTNIIVKNPIPEGTAYVRGTAKCENGCSIRYSMDGGVTFLDSDSEDNLYNYIEFHFKNIFPNKEVRMGFRAIVE